MASRRLLRIALASLLGVLVTCGGAPGAAGAAAKTKPRSACQKLARSHQDLARSPKLVTVVLGGDETGRIAACVLPRGKVRTLASWDDGLMRDWASVVKTAGTWVLVDEGHGDQYGGTSRSLTRHNVRTGRALTLAGYGCQIDLGSGRSCPDGTSYDEVALASTGVCAYEVTDLATARTTLEVISPAGVFTELAEGPVEALRLTRTHVVWTRDAVEQRAPLPAG